MRLVCIRVLLVVWFREIGKQKILELGFGFVVGTLAVSLIHCAFSFLFEFSLLYSSRNPKAQDFWF